MSLIRNTITLTWRYCNCIFALAFAYCAVCNIRKMIVMITMLIITTIIIMILIKLITIIISITISIFMYFNVFCSVVCFLYTLGLYKKKHDWNSGSEALFIWVSGEVYSPRPVSFRCDIQPLLSLICLAINHEIWWWNGIEGLYVVLFVGKFTV